jgi:hypothetical protein
MAELLNFIIDSKVLSSQCEKNHFDLFFCLDLTMVPYIFGDLLSELYWLMCYLYCELTNHVLNPLDYIAKKCLTAH